MFIQFMFLQDAYTKEFTVPRPYTCLSKSQCSKFHQEMYIYHVQNSPLLCELYTIGTLHKLY